MIDYWPWSRYFSCCFFSANMNTLLAVCTKDLQRAVIRICRDYTISLMITRQFAILISRAYWIFSSACPVSFKHLGLIIHTATRYSAVTVMCKKLTMDFSSWHTLWSEKPDHCSLFLLDAHYSRSGHVYTVLCTKKKWLRTSLNLYSRKPKSTNYKLTWADGTITTLKISYFKIYPLPYLERPTCLMTRYIEVFKYMREVKPIIYLEDLLWNCIEIT